MKIGKRNAKAKKKNICKFPLEFAKATKSSQKQEKDLEKFRTPCQHTPK